MTYTQLVRPRSPVLRKEFARARSKHYLQTESGRTRNTQFRLNFRRRPDGDLAASYGVWGGRGRRNRDGRTYRQGSGGARWNAWWLRPSAMSGRPICTGSACYGDCCDVTYGRRRYPATAARAQRTRGRQNVVVGDGENGSASYTRSVALLRSVVGGAIHVDDDDDDDMPRRRQ